MAKYKVIDARGVILGGKPVKEGQVLELGAGGQVNAWLHFKQIAPVDEAAEKAEAEKAEAEKAEAEKAEAEKAEAEKAEAEKAEAEKAKPKGGKK